MIQLTDHLPETTDSLLAAMRQGLLARSADAVQSAVEALEPFYIAESWATAVEGDAEGIPVTRRKLAGNVFPLHAYGATAAPAQSRHASHLAALQVRR